MTVRRAQQDDLQVLVRLNLEVQRLHLDTEPQFFRSPAVGDVERFFQDALDDDQKTVLVACDDDGTVVGYLLAEVRERAANPFMPPRRWFQIDQLGVDSGHRRRGHGCALVREAVSRAEKMGIGDLQTGVWAFNEASLSLFRSIGFRDMDIRLHKQIPDEE